MDIDIAAICEWASESLNYEGRFKVFTLIAEVEWLGARVVELEEALIPFASYMPQTTYFNLDRAKAVLNQRVGGTRPRKLV